MAVFSTFRLLAAGIAAAAALTSHVLPARELLTPAVAAYDELAPDLTEPEDTTLSECAVTIPVPLPEEGSVTISQAAPNTPPAAHTPAVAPVTPAQAAASVKIPSGPLVRMPTGPTVKEILTNFSDCSRSSQATRLPPTLIFGCCF